jgi:hypothetical protein
MSTLWSNILAKSSLAKALQETYIAISQSKIAQVHLPASLVLSLQIPLMHSISILPSLLEPAQPGLLLTTATTAPDEDDALLDDDPTLSPNPAQYFALLLLYSPSKILADLVPTPPQMHIYLRHSKPTLSLLQVSNASGLSIHAILTLTNTLLSRRLALAILPLSHREVYIVSPNAPMRLLATAASSFAQQYTTLPSLPRILASLCQGGPKPYKLIIPSTDHRETYLEVLAWLMRNGWVCHLRSFGWLRVGAIESSTENTEALFPPGPISLLSQTTDHKDMILPHPLRLTTEESVALEELKDRAFPPEDTSEVAEYARTHWHTFLRHFDGKHALEKISLLEEGKLGKPKAVRAFLEILERSEGLVAARWW